MTAANIEKVAEVMVSSGLRDAGYDYLNLDDCWAAKSRAADGSIVGDPHAFPSMKDLAAKVRARGLRFGLYTSENNKTCAGRPGSYGYELQDAATYCTWGVEFVKVDHCGTGKYPEDARRHMNESWVLLRQGFDKCAAGGGKPVVMSVEYCTADPAVKQCVPWFVGGGGPDHLHGCEGWVRDAGANMWRVASDISPSIPKLLTNAACSSSLQNLSGIWADGSGHWNDLDMLQVGHSQLNTEQEQLHFSLWAVLSAPLLISMDITVVRASSLRVLLNHQVIAVSQDPLLPAQQGRAIFLPAPGGSVFNQQQVSYWRCCHLDTPYCIVYG